MKKLFIDIETTPHVAYVWRLFDENVGLSQLIEPSRMLCVAWRMNDEPVEFAAEWQRGGRSRMLTRVHKAVDAADALVHYNGRSFDEKHLNREFLLSDLGRPDRAASIDLYATVKQQFRFASGKLEHVAKELELREGKLKTDFSLWSRVLAGDADAREEMERYNREDVELLVDLYDELLPWIDKHPNAGLYEGDELMRCTRCGSTNLTKNGFRRTSAGRFQRYSCDDCGSSSRGFKRVATTPLREG